jgi:hypothetical protein
MSYSLWLELTLLLHAFRNNVHIAVRLLAFKYTDTSACVSAKLPSQGYESLPALPHCSGWVRRGPPQY